MTSDVLVILHASESHLKAFRLYFFLVAGALAFVSVALTFLVVAACVHIVLVKLTRYILVTRIIVRPGKTQDNCKRNKIRLYITASHLRSMQRHW